MGLENTLTVPSLKRDDRLSYHLSKLFRGIQLFHEYTLLYLIAYNNVCHRLVVLMY